MGKVSLCSFVSIQAYISLPEWNNINNIMFSTLFVHRKYNLKVILDLHAAPGSQNGYEHSATRDGSIEWGKTEKSIQETVRVIEFFTARYVLY